MRTSHALLLRLIHDPGYDLSKARIEYLDRGAPGETKSIPIHRIRRISYQGEPLWEKRDAENFVAKEKTAKANSGSIDPMRQIDGDNISRNQRLV